MGSHLVVIPSVEFIEDCIVIVSKLLKLVPHVYNHVPRLLNLPSLRYGMLLMVIHHLGCGNLHAFTFYRAYSHN